MIGCEDRSSIEEQAEVALAGAMQTAVMLTAARMVGPGRTLTAVLERIEAVDFMFLDVARWVLRGKHRPYCKRL